MHRIVVVANPSASQFTGGAHREVMSILGKMGPVEAIWPESANDAEIRAAQAVAAGAEVVVAMGGDGIVHHVAQGLADSPARLGVIPVGTTNVFARLYGIPERPAKAARVIAEGNATSIGTARMTLDRGSVETTHHAVFACGFGLDAAVVSAADSDPYRKYRFGSIHYARTAFAIAFREFPKTKPHVSVKADHHEMLVSAAQIQFRDVYTYFGIFPLRVAGEPPDPMTVLTMTRLRRKRIPRIVTTLLRGGDLGSIPEMSTLANVKRLEFIADPPVAVQADGESLGLVDAGTVDWAPDSIRVITPQDLPDTG